MFRVLSAIVAMLCAAALPAAAPALGQGRVIESYAVVREDASLLVRGKVIRLAGIYIPDDGRTCRSYVIPRVCGNRAAVALDFKIQRFVRCLPVAVNGDGSLSAFCETNHSRFSAGVDLGAYLIGQGWALASADAPFEYHGLERIATSRCSASTLKPSALASAFRSFRSPFSPSISSCSRSMRSAYDSSFWPAAVFLPMGSFTGTRLLALASGAP
jgi:hypothetical protein